MRTITIPINISVAQLVGEGQLDEHCINYKIPDRSNDAKTETIRLAASLLDKYKRVALEVKIKGIQRDYRAPLAFTDGDKLYILKVCSGERHVEDSIFMVSDLVSAAENDLGNNQRAVGLVLCPYQSFPAAEELAARTKVSILDEESLISGIFN